jgi:membrane protein required for colicin V production
LTGWDWFVLAVFALSVGVGVWRGLVRTVFALGAWVVGLFGVALLSPTVAPWMPAELPPAVGYVALFLVLFVLVRVLGAMVARALHGIGLGGADRLLGAGLGVARALLVVLLAAIGAHLAGYSREPAWTRALSRPLLDGLVQWAEPLLPERLSGVRKA